MNDAGEVARRPNHRQRQPGPALTEDASQPLLPENRAVVHGSGQKSVERLAIAFAADAAGGAHGHAHQHGAADERAGPTYPIIEQPDELVVRTQWPNAPEKAK